jgi:ribonuclease E
MIHEEENLVRRAVRDMFDKDFDGIQVEGVEGWKEARDFMRVLMPSQAKKVHLYRGSKPLFAANGIEEVLHQIHQPVVNLKSGGYLVINQTEALVAIDVNSGRATKERNVEQTAFKTNMEAAAEAARQLRLRDLAGLIVIDFIDMEESKNNRAVEKCLKDALAQDRARIQMGKISGFGLMEISRQRRRLGVIEGATEACPHCHGAGRVRSAESAALMALRAVDIEVGKNGAGVVHLRVPTATALYILNFKRGHLDRLQEQRGVTLVVMVDDRLGQAESAVDRIETNEDFVPPASDFDPADLADDFVYDEAEDEDEAIEDLDDGAADDEDEEDDAEDGEPRREARAPRRSEGEDDGEGGRRRRRGRRGGRRAREEAGEADGFVWVRGRTPSLQDPFVWFDPLQPHAAAGDAAPRAESEPRLTDEARSDEGRGEGERGGRRRRRRGRGRGERGDAPVLSVDTADAAEGPSDGLDAPAEVDVPAAVPTEPKRRRVRRKVSSAEGSADAVTVEAAPPLEAPAFDASPEEAEAEAPEPEIVEAVELETVAVPEPEPVAAEAEVKAERARAPLHSTEDDPAQITAPPPKPKRGWWRL